jgi:hypothetical protein
VVGELILPGREYILLPRYVPYVGRQILIKVVWL